MAEWVPAIKISESPAKTPNPGHKRVWRLYDRRGKATADLLGTRDEEPRGDGGDRPAPSDRTGQSPRPWPRGRSPEIEPLLVDGAEQGQVVGALPTWRRSAAVRRADVERLDPGVQRLVNPHIYHVSLTEKLWALKQELMAAMRAGLPAKTREWS